MNSSYTPVPWEFREMIEEARKNDKNGNIHFFDAQDHIGTATGKIRGIKENTSGEFLQLDSGEEVRLDIIITLYGRPGPAYEKYDSFANACLDCMGGMD